MSSSCTVVFSWLNMASLSSILYFVFPIFGVCAIPPTSSLAILCGGCNISADIITASSTSWGYRDPAIGTPYFQSYVHLTAYTVTSRSLEKGTCVTHTSSPIPLETSYILYVQDYSDEGPISEKNANFSFSLNHAYSSFQKVWGYQKCTAALPTSPVAPLLEYPAPITSAIAYPSQVTSTASATALPSAALVQSSKSVRNHHTTQIIIVSITVPTAGLIVLLICFLAVRRYRKKRSQVNIKSDPDLTENTQPYVDRKAELEDEERRKHELDAAGIRYEMEGQDMFHEMPNNGNAEKRLSSLRQTHEIPGMEHSQEVEVPGNV